MLPLLGMPFGDERLRQEIESQFEVGTSTNGPLAVTGEQYVVIGHQITGKPKFPGTVDEGESHELGFDAESAYWLARKCFLKYAEGRRGMLYWRIPPKYEVYTHESYDLNTAGNVIPVGEPQKAPSHRIYIRCLISDKGEA